MEKPLDSISLITKNRVDSISLNNLELILKWAGLKLLSLPNPKSKPKLVSWPDYPTNFNSNFSNQQLKSPINSIEIDLMDNILDLILLSPDSISRKIISSRILISPTNLKPIYHWSTISHLLSLSPRTTKRYYQNGLRQIISKSNQEQINYFKSKIIN